MYLLSNAPAQVFSLQTSARGHHIFRRFPIFVMHAFLPLIGALNCVKFSTPHAYSTSIKIRQITIATSKSNRTIHACIMMLTFTFTLLYMRCSASAVHLGFLYLLDGWLSLPFSDSYDESAIVHDAVNNISSHYIRTSHHTPIITERQHHHHDSLLHVTATRRVYSRD